MIRAQLPLPDLFAGMNKTEEAYAQQLEAQKRAGLLAEWRYEKLTFKLADDCRFTPDFYVLENDGRVRIVETKGFWREDARVKIRVAAELFPEFTFVAATKSKLGGWDEEEF